MPLKYLRAMAQIPASGRREEHDHVYLEVIDGRVLLFATDGVAIAWFRPADATIEGVEDGLQSGIPCSAIQEIAGASETRGDFYDLEAKIRFNDKLRKVVVTAGGRKVTANQPDYIPEWRHVVEGCGPEEPTGQLCVDAAIVGRIGQALHDIGNSTQVVLVPTAGRRREPSPVKVVAPGVPEFGGYVMPWITQDTLKFPEWINELAHAAALPKAKSSHSTRAKNDHEKHQPQYSRN